MKKKSLLLSLIALVGLAGCDLNLDPVLREDTTKIEQPTDSPEVILQKAKEKAKTEIDEYKDDKDYRDKELGVLWELEDEAKAAIEAANSKEEIDEIVKNFKEKADALKTDAQYQAEEKALQEKLDKALDSLKQNLSIAFTLSLKYEDTKWSMYDQEITGTTSFTEKTYSNIEDGYEPLNLWEDEEGNCITYAFDYATNEVNRGYPTNSSGDPVAVPFEAYKNPLLGLTAEDLTVTEEGTLEVSNTDKIASIIETTTMYSIELDKMVLNLDGEGRCKSLSFTGPTQQDYSGDNLIPSASLEITARGEEVLPPEIPVPFESEPEQALLQQALEEMNQASSYTETLENEDFCGDDYTAKEQVLQYTSSTMLVDTKKYDLEYTLQEERISGYHINSAGETKEFTVEDGVVVPSASEANTTVEALHPSFTNASYAPECWTVADVDEDGNITLVPQTEYLATELMPCVVTDEMCQQYAYYSTEAQVVISKDGHLLSAAFEYDYGDAYSWLGIDSWDGLVSIAISDVNTTVIDENLDFSTLDPVVEEDEEDKIVSSLVGTWTCEALGDYDAAPEGITAPISLVIEANGTVTLNGNACEFVSCSTPTSGSVIASLVIKYNGQTISCDLDNTGALCCWTSDFTVYFVLTKAE